LSAMRQKLLLALWLEAFLRRDQKQFLAGITGSFAPRTIPSSGLDLLCAQFSIVTLLLHINGFGSWRTSTLVQVVQ
jgi:hypothetical protein